MLVAVLHALSLLPDFILYRLGIACGLIFHRFDHRHRRIGIRNLEIAFPEKSDAERERILRASYINLGRTGAEYVRLGGFFYRRLARRVTYNRLDVWNELTPRYPGKGALILTAHFGGFELLPAGHALHGFQIGLVHHTQRFLAGDDLVSFIRERAGVQIIRKHTAAREMLRSLKRGEIIGIPLDQNAKRSEAIWVPFFGELAATPSGFDRLAMMAGAPVVPVFIVRQPDGVSHVIEIYRRDPATAHRRPQRRRAGEHRPLSKSHRRDGPKVSRAMALDASPLPHPPSERNPVAVRLGALHLVLNPRWVSRFLRQG